MNTGKGTRAPGMVWLAICMTLGTPVPGDSPRELLEMAGLQGGLLLHVGCGNGELTARFRLDDRLLVQGLDPDPAKVSRAREHIRSLGVYGEVSVEHLVGSRLPHVDNIVNLVISEDPDLVPMGEIMRVLCPGGVALVQKDGSWKKSTKPWPEDIDEWTHFLHGPDNNAVGQDSVVGPPRHIQWMGGPTFARAHEQLASLSACVSSGGRIFYIIDDAPVVDIRIPSRWALVARDAFNGVVLWRRPVHSWADQLRRFRSGPPDLPHRLVAKDDRVYVTLRFEAPVTELDAASGVTLRTLEGTEGTRQILHLGDRLILLTDTSPETTRENDSQIRRGVKPAPGVRSIVAVGLPDGETLWRAETQTFVQPTLAADEGRVYYQTSKALHCLDGVSGKELWQEPRTLSLKGHEVGWEAPTLVAHDGMVLSADFKKVIAHSTEDGRQLWESSSSPGYNSPPDILFLGGLVWTPGPNQTRRGLDPASGQLKRTLTSRKGYMHARCYRNKATERFLLLANQGVQFLDMDSGEIWQNYWIRGTCQYGVLPANGLLYVTPDSCACNLKAKLNGFWALSSARKPLSLGPGAPRLQKGPAYSKVETPAARVDPAQQWPTYRGDPARSGRTGTTLAAALDPAWTVRPGGKLSSLTVAEGKVLVASVETHAVMTLDATTGEPLWTCTVGGRVDSPPTIYRGTVLFGSADGWVYCLRASDGQLAWRFRAAPEERRVCVKGQLESPWPVHGSVLVKDGEVLVAAGRSSYLDGGIRLHRLDPATGAKLSETVVYSPDPESDKQPAEGGKEMRGLLSDVLLADGDNVYMRHVKLDLQKGSETGKGVHLFSPIGLLDDTWWHRAYWLVSDHFLSHWSGWHQVGNRVPSGRILSYDEGVIYGYGRDKYPGGNTGQWRGGEKYHLFAWEGDFDTIGQRTPQPAAKRRGRSKKAARPALQYRWTREVPLLGRALVLAGENLFIAGPPDRVRTKGPSGEEALALQDPEEVLATWEGKKGGLLWAVSAVDGSKLAAYDIAHPPVFDGMAVAGGRLYMATTDGSVTCWKER